MILTGMMLVMVLAGELVLSYLFPSYTAKSHLAVPVYFWLFYTIAVVLAPSRLDTVTLAKSLVKLKSIKLLASLFVLLIICFIFKGHFKGVAVNFIAFYILLLVPESMYVISLKKSIKK